MRDSDSLAARAGLLFRRLAAYVIDSLLLLCFVVVAQAGLIALDLHPFVDRGGARSLPSGWTLHLWVSLSTTAPFLAYFSWAFASEQGATAGQRMLAIAVRSRDGERLSAGKSLVRAIVLLLPFELNHALMFHAAPWAGGPSTIYAAGLAGIWALLALYLSLPLFRRDGRSLHDLAANARVQRA